MNTAWALRIRGWALTPSPQQLVQDFFGQRVFRNEITPVTRVWRVEDALPPEHPIGSIRSVVVFEAMDQADVEIVPGSQGLCCPPEDAGHAIIRSTVKPLCSLMLDARCWYRILADGGLSCTIWAFALSGESK